MERGRPRVARDLATTRATRRTTTTTTHTATPRMHHPMHAYVRERLLGATVRTRVRDGRVFIGTLRCVDKQRNIVVGNVREYASETEATTAEATPVRTINMVLIGADERVSCTITDVGPEGDDGGAAASFAGLVI
jgi:small nuclear ribonucleoprotein (snRNP)-like protein